MNWSSQSLTDSPQIFPKYLSVIGEEISRSVPAKKVLNIDKAEFQPALGLRSERDSNNNKDSNARCTGLVRLKQEKTTPKADRQDPAASDLSNSTLRADDEHSDNEDEHDYEPSYS